VAVGSGVGVGSAAGAIVGGAMVGLDATGDSGVGATVGDPDGVGSGL
jgi:hypothetical protein